MYCSCNEAVERGSQRKLSRTKQANKYLKNITEKLIFNKRKGLVRDDIRICYQPSGTTFLQAVIVQSRCRALRGIRPPSNPDGHTRLSRLIENLWVSLNPWSVKPKHLDEALVRPWFPSEQHSATQHEYQSHNNRLRVGEYRIVPHQHEADHRQCSNRNETHADDETNF